MSTFTPGQISPVFGGIFLGQKPPPGWNTPGFLRGLPMGLLFPCRTLSTPPTSELDPTSQPPQPSPAGGQRALNPPRSVPPPPPHERAKPPLSSGRVQHRAAGDAALQRLAPMATIPSDTTFHAHRGRTATPWGSSSHPRGRRGPRSSPPSPESTVLLRHLCRFPGCSVLAIQCVVQLLAG